MCLNSFLPPSRRTDRRTVMLLAAVQLLSFAGLAQSFQPLFSFSGNSSTHRDITQRAILLKTADVCRDIAVAEGRDFSLTVSWRCLSFRSSFWKVFRVCSSWAEDVSDPPASQPQSRASVLRGLAEGVR